MESLKVKIQSGVSWSAVNVVVNQVFNIALIVFLTNYLSAATFGLFAMVAVLVQFLTVFQDVGLNASLIQKSDVNELQKSTVFWINISISAVAALGLFFSANLISRFYNTPELVEISKLLSISFLFNGLYSTHFALATKDCRFKELAIIDIIATIFSGLGSVYLAIVGHGVFALVWRVILLKAITFMLINLVIRWLPRFVFSVKAIREMFNFGLNYSFVRIFGHFATKMDEVLLGKFSSSSDLGLYSNAFKFVLMPLTLLKGQIVKVIFPVFSGIKGDLNKIKEVSLRISAILALIGFTLIFWIILIAPEVVEILLPEDWQGVSSIIRLLSIYSLFEISIFPGAILLAIGKSSIYMRLMITTKSILLAFMYIGVLKFGMVGMVIGMIGASAISFIPYVYVSGREINLKVREVLKVNFIPLAVTLFAAVSSYFLLESGSSFIVDSSLQRVILKSMLYLSIALSLFYNFQPFALTQIINLKR